MAENNEALVEAFSGAGGALFALLTTYPLLTINTRQQTGEIRTRRSAKAGKARKDDSEASSEEATTTSKNLFEGLYDGLKPAVIGTLASNTVYFYLMGYLRAGWLASTSHALN